MNGDYYANILIELAFRANECCLVQMNVFLFYCLPLNANDCIFSGRIEQQKV